MGLAVAFKLTQRFKFKKGKLNLNQKMKASSILDDYISSFESSFIKSTKKTKAEKENYLPTNESKPWRHKEDSNKSFERYLHGGGQASILNASSVPPHSKTINDLLYESDEKLISSLLNDRRDKRLTLDDIPSRENAKSRRDSSPLSQIVGLNSLSNVLERSGNKMLNFKDFYEQSKLESKSTKRQASRFNSKIEPFKTIEDSKFQGKRSKSTGLENRDMFQNKLQSKRKNEPKLSVAAVKYNINEFLPKESSSSSRLSSSFLGGQSFLMSNHASHQEAAARIQLNQQQSSQQAAFELFTNNYQKDLAEPTHNIFQNNNRNRAFSQQQYLRVSQLDSSPGRQNPKLQKIDINNNLQPLATNGSSVCSCGGLTQQAQSQYQMQMTQRSSCSCQFSNSSGSRSHIASPLSTNQKYHLGHPSHHNHQQSISGLIGTQNIFQYAPPLNHLPNQQQQMNFQNQNSRQGIHHSQQSSIANVNLNSQFNKAINRQNLLPLGTPQPNQLNQNYNGNSEVQSELPFSTNQRNSNPFINNYQGQLNVLSSSDNSPFKPQNLTNETPFCSNNIPSSIHPTASQLQSQLQAISPSAISNQFGQESSDKNLTENAA